MKYHILRSLIVAWLVVTTYLSVTLWSRGGSVDDETQMIVHDVRQSHAPHAPPPSAAADPVLGHRRVVAEVKAKHLQQSNRTGWDRYFQYQTAGDHVWPTELNERDDRILNQLHLTRQDSAGLLRSIQIFG